MATSIVSEPLNEKNYKNWRSCMESYLISLDLWKVVEDNEDEISASTPEEREAFRRKDAAALHAIKISCSPDILAKIREITGAKHAWKTLATMNWELPEYETPADVEHDQAMALFNAITSGDLNYFETLSEPHSQSINAKLFRNDKTNALHLAVACKQLEVVKELVSKMSDEAMKLRVEQVMNFSALDMAAFNGEIEIVGCLIDGNIELLEGDPGATLRAACLGGHKDVIYRLYSKIITNNVYLPDNVASSVLCGMVYRKCFDIAFDMFRRRLRWDPAMTSIVFGSLLYEPEAYFSARLSFWQRWICCCIPVNLPNYASSDDYVSITINGQGPKKPNCTTILSNFLGIKQISDLRLTHKIVALLSKTMSTFNNAQIHMNGLDNVIFKAASLGLTDMIVEIIRKNPNFLWFTDDDGRNIFHIAVLHRQEQVFSLIYGIGALKERLILSTDKQKCSIVHMAGEPTPQRLTDQIQGPALLMQRELQWFKEMERIFPNNSKSILINKDGDDPYKVFDKNHKQLVEQGEKWMKGIAQSSTVVGTLIITIMFAALYTVPGGNDNDGIPLFLRRKAFKLFVVSDAISLSASATSVLMFLSILTSRYAVKDFLVSLPTKLIIALFFLFISIATMMVAFCSAVFIVLKGQLSFCIPIVVLASIPIIVFVWSQFPLLGTTLWSTYGPGIFDKKKKKWL